jgi:hypothetical protein
VLSRQEVVALLEHLIPPFRLIVEFLYGSGLRLLEGPLGFVSPLDR